MNDTVRSRVQADNMVFLRRIRGLTLLAGGGLGVGVGGGNVWYATPPTSHFQQCFR